MISREKLLEDGVYLENSLLKVPLENVVKFFRLTSKSLEKEIQLTVQLITTLASKKGLTKSDIAKEVKEQLNKLKNLRTKVLTYFPLNIFKISKLFKYYLYQTSSKM